MIDINNANAQVIVESIKAAFVSIGCGDNFAKLVDFSADGWTVNSRKKGGVKT